ncbi:MAG TPA: DUF4391 domain-containing protein [Rhodanobacteraceae bacterium]|nr:DUF4391 domain-containing protein [Rhodanobacteraceae bacterium]
MLREIKQATSRTLAWLVRADMLQKIRIPGGAHVWMSTRSLVGESLRDQLDRLARVRTFERECARLDAQLARERQFNRKVEFNRALREARQALRAVKSGS